MTKEEEIYNNVTAGSCHQCEYGEIAQGTGLNGEPVLECTIEDFRKCPVVIHDMSL
jgi:hypothetical protein